MSGCPEGRFTSRVDFEIRAPQIAANAVLKAKLEACMYNVFFFTAAPFFFSFFSVLVNLVGPGATSQIRSASSPKQLFENRENVDGGPNFQKIPENSGVWMESGARVPFKFAKAIPLSRTLGD
jgi:hypothetical protein